jgi:hypothetical protein
MLDLMFFLFDSGSENIIGLFYFELAAASFIVGKTAVMFAPAVRSK